MSIVRALRHGLRRLTHRADADREDADEIQHFYDQAVRDQLARGLSPEDARRSAQRALGNRTALREEVGRAGWESVVTDLGADLGYAARRIRRDPGFTAACVLTLALGIGASTAIFSVVEPVLFAPLPYPHADRVVAITDLGAPGAGGDVTYGSYEELLARAHTFVGLAAADRWRPALTGDGVPERLEGDQVTATYFRTLGVPPAIGRDFDASDEQIGAPRVAILADGLVRRRFGGSADVLGRQVTLDGVPYTVIGVMPPGFQNVLATAAQVWSPMRYRSHAPFQGPEWGHHLRMVGRLEPAATLDAGRRDLNAIARAPLAESPRPSWAALDAGLAVEPLRDSVTRQVRPALLAIMGAVLLVLAIACVNVTNLVLVRGEQRRAELSLRATLGAGRGRLVRQLLSESVMLAGIGGALGYAIAAIGVRALVALAPAGLPRADAIRLDGPVLAFALVITVIASLTVGLVPALQAVRADLRGGADAGARSTPRARHALRRSLVVAEVALALTLLVGAGLLLRSLERLFAVPPGFDPSHLLTMQVQIVGPRYRADTARQQFFERALDAVRAVPGVVDAAFTSQLPLSGDLEGYGVDFEQAAHENPTDYRDALRYAVTPDWFRTMRIPLRRGRFLDAHDRPGGPEAIVINESLARRVFGGRDPIGQRMRAGPELGRSDRPADIVVGVVGDVRQSSLAVDPPDAFYVAMGQWWWVDDVQSLVVRTNGGAAALTPALRRAIWSVDPDQPIARVATMDDLVARSEADRRFVLTVFEAFALAALALAAIGIFGVVSGTVTERSREIGVRAALGASRGSVLALVIGQGMTLTALGVAVGIVGSVAATRAIASLLYGVTALDPVTYAGVVATLALASLAACSAPAWRAARVDPAIALRAE